MQKSWNYLIELPHLRYAVSKVANLRCKVIELPHLRYTVRELPHLRCTVIELAHFTKYSAQITTFTISHLRYHSAFTISNHCRADLKELQQGKPHEPTFPACTSRFEKIGLFGGNIGVFFGNIWLFLNPKPSTFQHVRACTLILGSFEEIRGSLVEIYWRVWKYKALLYQACAACACRHVVIGLFDGNIGLFGANIWLFCFI